MTCSSSCLSCRFASKHHRASSETCSGGDIRYIAILQFENANLKGRAKVEGKGLFICICSSGLEKQNRVNEFFSRSHA
jgi:hypothetical protein